MWIDDLLVGSQSPELVDEFVTLMKDEFDMTMFEDVNLFLRLQVKQSSEVFFVTQSTYAKNLVKRFGLESAMTKKVPMSTIVKLTKDPEGVPVDQTLYMSMIGSLLYLTSNRPGLCYSVGICARFQSEPKECHMKAVKNIIKYIKGKSDFGL